MTRYEQGLLIIRRTAGSLGILALVGWLFFLVGLRVFEASIPSEVPTPVYLPAPEVEEKLPDPPIDAERPNCIRMEDLSYVCDKPEEGHEDLEL